MRELLKFSFLNLFRNKSRTALSLIAIVIGVSAIIALVSVVDGLFGEVQGALSQVQSIRVSQKNAPGPYGNLEIEWKNKLDGVQGVRAAVPIVVGVATSIDGEYSVFGQTQVIGVDFTSAQKLTASAVQLAVSAEISEGRDIRPGETGVVIIGKQTKKNLNKFLNQSIEINGKKFKIVGVFSSGSALINSGLVIPIEDARELFNVGSDRMNALFLEVNNPEQEKRVVEIINFRFSEDLSAVSASDLSEQFGDVLGSLRLLVAAVAGISAVVAGVGIINTMLMSVIERFREIGALKAVGWTNSNIMKMILFESIMIGVIGGFLGMVAGSAVAVLLHQTFGLTVAITPMLLLEAFSFAVLLGLVGGLYPAYIASKADPIESLRVE